MYLTEIIRLGSIDTTAATQFIAKVYAMYEPWPMDRNSHVMLLGGEGEDQKFAWFELVPNTTKVNTVEVKWFAAYPRRAGSGMAAMKKLQELAAQSNISLTLFPWDKGQVSQSALMKFYKKAGFAATKPGAKNMRWSPPQRPDADFM
jgi:hypothetical protein